MQKLAHPRKFGQVIQLTDGSTIRISTLSPEKPFLKLTADSFSHPSWNPNLMNKLKLSEHGEISRFKQRFNESLLNEDTLSEFGDLMGGGNNRLDIKHPC